MADLIGGDRRTSKRFYGLELPLRCRWSARDGAIEAAHGITCDMSTAGVRFVIDGEGPPAGVEVELSIEWPYLLQGVCPLEIYVRGRVLDSSTRGVVVAVCSKRFRTRGRQSFEEEGYTASISLVV